MPFYRWRMRPLILSVLRVAQRRTTTIPTLKPMVAIVGARRASARLARVAAIAAMLPGVPPEFVPIFFVPTFPPCPLEP